MTGPQSHYDQEQVNVEVGWEKVGQEHTARDMRYIAEK